MTKVQLYRAVSITSFLFGAIIAGVGTGAFAFLHKSAEKKEVAKAAEVDKDVSVKGVVNSGGPRVQLILSNGVIAYSSQAQYTPEGVIYEAAGKRYKAEK